MRNYCLQCHFLNCGIRHQTLEACRLDPVGPREKQTNINDSRNVPNSMV